MRGAIERDKRPSGFEKTVAMVTGAANAYSGGEGFKPKKAT